MARPCTNIREPAARPAVNPIRRLPPAAQVQAKALRCACQVEDLSGRCVGSPRSGRLGKRRMPCPKDQEEHADNACPSAAGCVSVHFGSPRSTRGLRLLLLASEAVNRGESVHTNSWLAADPSAPIVMTPNAPSRIVPYPALARWLAVWAGSPDSSPRSPSRKSNHRKLVPMSGLQDTLWPILQGGLYERIHHSFDFRAVLVAFPHSHCRTCSATARRRSSPIRSRYTLAMSSRECPMMASTATWSRDSPPMVSNECRSA